MTEYKFWMVYSPDVAPSEDTHKKVTGARGEALRRLEAHPRARFYIMEATSFVEFPEVHAGWTEVRDTEPAEAPLRGPGAE